MILAVNATQSHIPAETCMQIWRLLGLEVHAGSSTGLRFSAGASCLAIPAAGPGGEGGLSGHAPQLSKADTQQAIGRSSLPFGKKQDTPAAE